MSQEIINKIKSLINNNLLNEAEMLIEESNNIKNVELLYLSGLVKHKLNKDMEAIEFLKKINEKIPEVYFLMANAYENLLKYDKALHYLDESIKTESLFWQGHFNKGLIFMIKKKNFVEAEKSFKKVIQIKPKNFDAEFYLGNLAAHYDLKIAEKHYRKVVSFNPGHKKARAELGKILLFNGELNKGWSECKVELDYLEKVYPENIKNIPIWNGKNPENQKLLIFREQGLGDEILYASCYKEIIDKTKKCFFVVEDRLVNLLKNSFPKAEFLSEKEFSKHTDLSKILPTARIQNCMLPMYLRKTLNDFPKQKSYLVADKNKKEIWKKKLSKDSKGKLKIGIAWSSGSNNLNQVENKGILSPVQFNLKDWEIFLSINNIFIVNLMYKNVKKEIDCSKIKNKIKTYNDLNLKDDIDNDAALISNLDVVISAQTWIGDFASALGAEVLKFHNKYSFTRLGQKNIPWNNSKVFDMKNGNWKDTFKLIKSLLNKRVVK